MAGLVAGLLVAGVVAAPAAVAKPAKTTVGDVRVKVHSWDIRISGTGLGPVVKADVRGLPIGYNALLVNGTYEVTSGCLGSGRGEVAPGTQRRQVVTAGTRYYTINETAGSRWRPLGEEDFGMSAWPSELLPSDCPAGYAPSFTEWRTLGATVQYTSEATGDGPVLPVRSEVSWQLR